MLTYEDSPIIERAIRRRLDSEPGVRVLEIPIKDKGTHIAVGVLCIVNDKIIVRSVFDLPPQFELSHVHNEVDEIAEGCKEARLKLLFTGANLPDKGDQSEVYAAKGTGRRGNWKYGERSH